MSAGAATEAEALVYDMRPGWSAEARVFARFYALALSGRAAGHGIATPLQQLIGRLERTERIQGVVVRRIFFPHR